MCDPPVARPTERTMAIALPEPVTVSLTRPSLLQQPPPQEPQGTSTLAAAQSGNPPQMMA
eukprot:84850-Amphidinium_carterae.1